MHLIRICSKNVVAVLIIDFLQYPPLVIPNIEDVCDMVRDLDGYVTFNVESSVYSQCISPPDVFRQIVRICPQNLEMQKSAYATTKGSKWTDLISRRIEFLYAKNYYHSRKDRALAAMYEPKLIDKGFSAYRLNIKLKTLSMVLMLAFFGYAFAFCVLLLEIFRCFRFSRRWEFSPQQFQRSQNIRL